MKIGTKIYIQIRVKLHDNEVKWKDAEITNTEYRLIGSLRSPRGNDFLLSLSLLARADDFTGIMISDHCALPFSRK